MSILLGIHSLSKSFGTQVLFQDLSLTFNEGDQIGLLGPNGAGKSTLLKIIMEKEVPDDGYISRRKDLRLGYASQAPEFPSLSLLDTVLEDAHDKNSIETQTRAQTYLSKAQFTDFTIIATTLSGGWKKRLDIVRALVNQPHLLLLDEPTNHLDLEGILWLENFLNKEKMNFVVISHDRYFLEKVSNKIVEINPCYPQGLFVSEGNMSSFMDHKDAFLEAQKKTQRGLASTVRDEIEWLKKSPKARTTKSQSRIQRAYAMMDELSELKSRNKTEKVDIDFSSSDRQTRKLIVVNNLTKSIGGK